MREWSRYFFIPCVDVRKELTVLGSLGWRPVFLYSTLLLLQRPGSVPSDGIARALKHGVSDTGLGSLVSGGQELLCLDRF